MLSLSSLAEADEGKQNQLFLTVASKHETRSARALTFSVNKNPESSRAMSRRFDSIYLVANLAQYDFGNVILLADDVNAIATELVRASNPDCEQLLFLGRVLATAVEASRRVVGNWGELEELLSVNWCDDPDGERKWELVREESPGRVVNRVATKVLMGDGGEKCLGVVKAFYKKFSCKEEFRKVIEDVRKGLVWREAAWNYLCLEGKVDPEIEGSLKGLQKELPKGEASQALTSSVKCDLPSLVLMYNSSTISPEKINKMLAGIFVLIQTGDKDFLQGQLQAIRNLAKNSKQLEAYQDFMTYQPFYEVNLELLKAHHRTLLDQEIPYDSSVILLCHLMYAKDQNPQFLQDFLNHQTFGCPSNLELVLAELQNFS